MRIRLHPDADAEFQDVAQWYEERVRGLGDQFLSEANDAFIDIENHPQRFGRVAHRAAREIRRRMLVHFPYSIIYEVRAEECIAVAIAHASRRPGYWIDRFK